MLPEFVQIKRFLLAVEIHSRWTIAIDDEPNIEHLTGIGLQPRISGIERFHVLRIFFALKKKNLY